MSIYAIIGQVGCINHVTASEPQSKVRWGLAPWLSQRATAELVQVEEILSNVVLVDSPDNKLRTSDVYKAIMNNSATAVFSEFIWL